MNNEIKMNPMGLSKPSFSKESSYTGKHPGKYRLAPPTEKIYDYSQYAYEKYQRYRIYTTKVDKAIPRHRRSTSSFFGK